MQTLFHCAAAAGSRPAGGKTFGSPRLPIRMTRQGGPAQGTGCYLGGVGTLHNTARIRPASLRRIQQGALQDAPSTSVTLTHVCVPSDRRCPRGGSNRTREWPVWAQLFRVSPALRHLMLLIQVLIEDHE